ncbi:MAG: hypothetical protein OEY94_06460 [Alphaproteobacteria bacterium]|nr:hypothetical protein [Alphaproteobacteria bacterium]
MLQGTAYKISVVLVTILSTVIFTQYGVLSGLFGGVLTGLCFHIVMRPSPPHEKPEK